METTRKLTWRRAVAFWPEDIRKRYGMLCNRLEDQGIPFPESEIKAFHITCKFLDAYNLKNPNNKIEYVLPYHVRGVDGYGHTVWVPRGILQGVTFDNSFELDLKEIEFLNALSKALQSIKLHKTKLSDHARSLSDAAYARGLEKSKSTASKRQSPDDNKIVQKKSSGRGRRFKHSDKVKEMFK